MRQEPLTESYFYILLCLFEGVNHGYGIMQMTGALSKGRVKIGSGTMYGATSNMMKKGWIKECGSERDSGQERRRLYELTDIGKEVLLSEIIRLREVLSNAEKIMGGK